MNAREWLDAELKRCHADASRIRERAPRIGTTYIGHRLLQLDRRFSRHGWGWREATTRASSVRVIPAIYGEHDAEKVAHLAMRKLGHQRQPYAGILSIALDIDTVAKRIQLEFGWGITEVLSPRAFAWGVRLGQLSPDPMLNRQAVDYKYGPAIHIAEG